MKQNDEVVDLVWDPKIETWSAFVARMKVTVEVGRWFRILTVGGRA